MTDREMTDKEKKIMKIANNVLYFDDNSDYGTALWKILFELVPKLEGEIKGGGQLDYIEE